MTSFDPWTVMFHHEIPGYQAENTSLGLCYSNNAPYLGFEALSGETTLNGSDWKGRLSLYLVPLFPITFYEVTFDGGRFLNFDVKERRNPTVMKLQATGNERYVNHIEECVEWLSEETHGRDIKWTMTFDHESVHGCTATFYISDPDLAIHFKLKHA